MNIGQKAKVIKTGEIVEIISAEKEEFETVFTIGQPQQNIFVDPKGNIRTGRFMIHEVKYLDGPNKGNKTVMKVSDLSSEPES